MKKFSIIMPVYNCEDAVRDSVNAILNIDYPKKNFEVIIVNNNSFDRTVEIVKDRIREVRKQRLKIRLFNERRQGRMLARAHGARKAKFDNLVFIDVRCVVDRNLLKNFVGIDYQPVMGTAYMDPQKSIFDRFFWSIRSKYYGSYFEERSGRLKITKDNFDEIPKGTGVFLCDKKLFLDSQFESDNYTMCSDDTKILKNIVEKKPIIKDFTLKVLYLNRSNFGSNFRHIYERGPKFADYYLSNKGPFYNYYLFFLILIPLFFLVLFKYPVYVVGLFLIMIFIPSLILGFISGAKKFSDLILVSLLAISFGFAFLLGIIKARLFIFLSLSLISILLFYILGF